jgi:hypothetical protein
MRDMVDIIGEQKRTCQRLNDAVVQRTQDVFNCTEGLQAVNKLLSEQNFLNWIKQPLIEKSDANRFNKSMLDSSRILIQISERNMLNVK